MPEIVLDVPLGNHVINTPASSARAVSYDHENEIARVQLSLESLHTKELKVNHPSTTLDVYLNRNAAIELLVALSNISNAEGWPLQEVISRPNSAMPPMLRQGPRPTPKKEND